MPVQGEQAAAGLHFWFVQSRPRRQWFAKDPAVDALLLQRFLGLTRGALSDERDAWGTATAFLFEGFIKRLRGISGQENSPGVNTGDFTYEGSLTRGAVLPLGVVGPGGAAIAGSRWDFRMASNRARGPRLKGGVQGSSDGFDQRRRRPSRRTQDQALATSEGIGLRRRCGRCDHVQL